MEFSLHFWKTLIVKDTKASEIRTSQNYASSWSRQFFTHVGTITFVLSSSHSVFLCLSGVLPWSFLSFFQLVNNPLASQAAAAAAAAAMGSIASSQAFGNALSSLQGVTGQLVTNAQGQVSRRWSKQWILMAGWSWDKNEFRLYDSNLKVHILKINKYWFARQGKKWKV